MYRTIKYQGESLKKLKSVIEEIDTNDEHIIVFTVETWEE